MNASALNAIRDCAIYIASLTIETHPWHSNKALKLLSLANEVIDGSMQNCAVQLAEMLAILTHLLKLECAAQHSSATPYFAELVPIMRDGIKFLSREVEAETASSGERADWIVIAKNG